MNAIDKATKSKELQQRVESIATDMMKQDQMTQLWNSVGTPLIKGILATSTQYGSAVSMTFRVAAILNGLKEIAVLTDRVSEGLQRKLTLYDNNSLTMTLVLHKKLGIIKKNSEQITLELKSLKVVDKADNFDMQHMDKFEGLSEESFKDDPIMKDNVKKTKQFLQSYHSSYTSTNMESFSMTIKAVADKITDQLLRIMDSQLIQPIATLGVSALIDAGSRKIQGLLIGEDKTYAQLINENAKAYVIARSQAEMIYFAEKQQENAGKVDKMVSERVKNVREGAPANIAETMAIAKANGVNLKVVDDPNYQLTDEDKANGVKVVLIKYGENGQIGHAYYKSSNSGDWMDDPNSKGNDCVYAALSKIIKETQNVDKSASDLRNETAECIEKNPLSYSQVITAETWIQSRYPEEATRILMTAGLHIKPSGDIGLDPGDIALLIRCLQNPLYKMEKRGYPFNQDFKEAAENAQAPHTVFKDAQGNPVQFTDAQGNPIPPPTTLHHLVPNSQLRQDVLNLYQNTSSTEFEKQLTDYLNQPHIKSVLTGMANQWDNAGQFRGLDPQTHQPLTENVQGQQIYTGVGRVLQASILTNPNNLVYGISNRLRHNDPGNALDTGLLNLQSNRVEIQNYQNNPNLNTWGAVPPTNHVHWQELSNVPNRFDPVPP